MLGRVKIEQRCQSNQVTWRNAIIKVNKILIVSNHNGHPVVGWQFCPTRMRLVSSVSSMGKGEYTARAMQLHRMVKMIRKSKGFHST